MTILVAVGTQPAKGKTKAKARYLKRKKERRKHRKVAIGSKKISDQPANSIDDEGEDEDDNEVSEPLKETPELKKPPRKRQKLDSDEEVESSNSPSEESDEDEDEDVEELTEPPPLSPRPQSPTPPPPVLPVFPLPVAPDAPPKAALALQGLDQALLTAELIDPTLSVPLDAIDKHVGRATEKGDQPVLSEKMKKRLRDLGIVELFAVQTALLPFLLPAERRARALYLPYDPPRDVCASAPTGSGKTLAYVVPIVEILSSRLSTRLRALVVLPTRDLVLQVQETFEAVAKGRGLKIGVATGQHSFAHEQSQLVGDQSRTLHGGSSKVDILICTPGRLIDHLSGTRNFTLQHLRFLVIDEADRLLAQSFQDWLARVLGALRPLSTSSQPHVSTDSTATTSESLSNDIANIALDSTTEQGYENREIPFHDAVAPSFLSTFSYPSGHSNNFQTDLDDPKHSSCQKLLFSATLTRDPARIAALGLRDPKYFIVQGKKDNEAIEQDEAEGKGWAISEGFAMPSSLSEHYLTTSTARKPLALFHLVHSRNVTNALVFTKSAESTARLVKLFTFFEESLSSSAPSAAMEVDGEREGSPDRKKIVAHAYSSDLPAGERKAILEKFKKREIDLLICSDLISRGIDIAHVPHVVSYDAPVDMRKYVHRVGRTARAGRAGDAWTLVEDQEARYFKSLMREAVHLEKIKKEKIGEKDTADLEKHYEVALEKLREAYSRSDS